MRAPHAVIVLAALAGCSIPDAPRLTDPEGPSPSEWADVELGEPFTLAPGEGAQHTGVDFVLRFLEVASDSRCPEDVNCVWAGDAELVVTIAQNGEERTHRLHTHGHPVGPSAVDLASAHRLELLDLQPGTRSDRPIPQESYRATFRLVVPKDRGDVHESLTPP